MLYFDEVGCVYIRDTKKQDSLNTISGITINLNKYMKRKLKIIMILSLLGSFSSLRGQDKVKIELSGFVSAEAIFDTRKVVSARDGDVLLYPAPEILDAKGKDINKGGSFNFVSIHSRLRAKTTPYGLWGGSITALLECDFVGTSNDKVSMVRMRHAMLQFTKGRSTIIAGQYWHPMFVTSCFPEISSWGAAVPVAVLSRNPQIRYAYAFAPQFRGSIAVLSQVDFKSTGPNGANSEYLRNTSTPEFDAHLEYGDPSRCVVGVVGGTKALKPREINAIGNQTDESIRTYHALAYASLKTSKMHYKLQGIYAEDGYNMLMIGGYGVSGIDDKTGAFSYEPIASATVWGEMASRYEGTVNFGIFAGYSENLGANKEMVSSTDVYARGADVKNVWRVAPRIILGYKKFQFMAEVNQTFANYGTPNKKMEVEDAERVGNTRFQLHLKYSF